MRRYSPNSTNEHKMKKHLIYLALIASAVPAMAQDKSRVVPADAVVWRAHPLFVGAQIATLVGDPTKPETIVQRFKYPPNFKVAPHTHSYTEVATVVSGTLGYGEGDTFDTAKGVLLKAGSVFVFPGTPAHYVWTTTEETIVQFVFTGPAGIVFRNPADDPRKK